MADELEKLAKGAEPVGTVVFDDVMKRKAFHIDSDLPIGTDLYIAPPATHVPCSAEEWASWVGVAYRELREKNHSIPDEILDAMRETLLAAAPQPVAVDARAAQDWSDAERWQPIETAPRDGTEVVIAWRPPAQTKPIVAICQWSDGWTADDDVQPVESGWFDGSGARYAPEFAIAWTLMFAARSQEASNG